MAEYQQVRDVAALPICELTAQLATLEPLPPEMQQLLGRSPAARRRWTPS